MPEEDGIVEFPVDGTLDLHTFRPREVKTLVPDYLDACLEKGITEVRIIHGKGTGALRQAVQEYCRTQPGIHGSRVAEQWEGGLGATVITLEG